MISGNANLLASQEQRMNGGIPWQQIVQSQLYVVPYMIILVVCVCCSLAFSRRYPPVATLAFLGFGLLLMNVIAGSATTIWMISNRGNLQNSSAIMMLFQVMRILLQLSAYVLLLMAIFGYRTDPYAVSDRDLMPMSK